MTKKLILAQGARDDTATRLMKPVVAKLSQDDIARITAYVASTKP